MKLKVIPWLCLALLLGFASSHAFGATLDLRVTDGSDDAEEHLNAGVDVTSSDLEIVHEDAGAPATDEQLVGMRWLVPLDAGAEVTNAYIEFVLKEVKGSGTNDAPVNVVIEGQLDPNPAAFTSAAKNITDRARTQAQVKWTLPAGMAVGDTFQTPDISAIIRELIGQEGWVSGNAVVIILRDDKDDPSTGLRCVQSYNGSATAAPLLRIEVFSPEAKSPKPADGAGDVTLPVLEWTAGDGAVSHQVYIGTQPELGAADVAGPPTPVAMYFHVAGFTPGVTYYWRVDEIAADGAVTAGKVWSFTAMPVTAYDPSPADGGVWQRNDTAIQWAPGQGAVSHSVYGGTDQAAVAAGDPSVLLATQEETSLTLGALEPLTVFYWKVDEVDSAGAVVPGSLWSIQVAGKNIGGWNTAAATAEPGFLATYVADGVYDIGAFGGEMTYEFVVRSNPDETQASMCLIGRRDFGDIQAGLKYEQWNNTQTYGATVFGVMDYNFNVANAPGEYTHVVFVSSEAAAKTDLYVNGVLAGSVASAISLSGPVGIGYGAQDRPPADSYFDDFDGSIFGVAIYDRVLSDAEIAANADAFLLGGPEAVALDLRIAAGDDDAEEHLNAGMDITSTDLEIVHEDAGAPATDEQLIGMRWIVPLDAGAELTNAYIEFVLKEVKGS
ncbi:MAG: LamG domain-containing protein, partial [Phycisphaerae bacterium]|nr:LamG domain-containing protein [Phycisphaerae bacterium]